jgi:hypothetical protein
MYPRLRIERLARAGSLTIVCRRPPRCCFGATPLVGELPRSNGQTTAWPSAPSRARVRVMQEVNAGAPRLFWRDPSSLGATP